METIESLRRKIRSAEDLHGVVKTMKAMAAVSIRQYERAVESLDEYSRAVDMGFQVLLRQKVGPLFPRQFSQQALDGGGLGAVVFGSDQGMVGQFNDVIAHHAVETLTGLQKGNQPGFIMAVGMRVFSRLQEAGQSVAEWTSLPGSVAAITSAVQDMVLKLESWQSRKGIGQIVLFYNRPKSGTSYDPQTVHLLPMAPQWLEELEKKSWPSRSLPQFTMSWEQLFSSLVREYLFIALYQAFANSLASENASRLAAMQVAERNVEERLQALTGSFNQLRQTTIDAELFDLIAGFEAMTQ
jgi:F-type H+-transporting ATPase subunit gamma